MEYLMRKKNMISQHVITTTLFAKTSVLKNIFHDFVHPKQYYTLTDGPHEERKAATKSGHNEMIVHTSEHLFA